MNIILQDLDISIVRKKIKHLHLRVCQPTGQVKISAPKRMTMDYIYRFVASKLKWIQKNQQKIRSQAYQTFKLYINGEQHDFNGNAYFLKIVASEKRPSITLSDPHIIMNISSDANTLKKQNVLDNWYRSQLIEKTNVLISTWEKRMGVSVSQFKIRKMKTRWGSCSPKSRSIRINLELIKKAPECLEYVVVHELAHLIEASHNKRFIRLMDQYLPQWKISKDILNKTSSSH